MNGARGSLASAAGAVVVAYACCVCSTNDMMAGALWCLMLLLSMSIVLAAVKIRVATARLGVLDRDEKSISANHKKTLVAECVVVLWTLCKPWSVLRRFKASRLFLTSGRLLSLRTDASFSHFLSFTSTLVRQPCWLRCHP